MHSADHLIVVWVDHHQLVERARNELMAVFRVTYSLAVLERELNVGRFESFGANDEQLETLLEADCYVSSERVGVTQVIDPAWPTLRLMP